MRTLRKFAEFGAIGVGVAASFAFMAIVSNVIPVSAREDWMAIAIVVGGIVLGLIVGATYWSWISEEASETAVRSVGVAFGVLGAVALVAIIATGAFIYLFVWAAGVFAAGMFVLNRR